MLGHANVDTAFEVVEAVRDIDDLLAARRGLLLEPVDRPIRQGLSFGDRLLKLSAAFLPSSVYTTLGRTGCVACTCCKVILPAAKSFDRLLGTMEPLPPLGGTVSTSCSTAQSPLMFGCPSASRSGRFEVSTAFVWN
jgi:hypothetical protein